MYGVVWMTPPSRPATSEATASVSRMERVSYSSPTAAALSVQSMPPTIVARANGNTTGSLPSAYDEHALPPGKRRIAVKGHQGRRLPRRSRSLLGCGGGTSCKPPSDPVNRHS